MDCSFSATSGELIGILGANGAGKSTLIKLLAGVIKPDAGDAVLDLGKKNCSGLCAARSDFCHCSSKD